MNAAGEIANVLANNDNIAHVDLSMNNLRDAGAEVLADALKGHPSLIHLDL